MPTISTRKLRFPVISSSSKDQEEGSCRLCECHRESSSKSSSLTPRRRWFGRIRRRPSLSSCCTAEREARKKTLLKEFEELYQNAEAEVSEYSVAHSRIVHSSSLNGLLQLVYATESQSSIYYASDWVAAKDALDAWLRHYDELCQVLDESEIAEVNSQWENLRRQLYEQLRALPPPWNTLDRVVSLCLCTVHIWKSIYIIAFA